MRQLRLRPGTLTGEVFVGDEVDGRGDRYTKLWVLDPLGEPTVQGAEYDAWIARVPR